MASSADFNNNRGPSVPVKRNDSTSISSSPARLQGSSRRSGTSVAGSRLSQGAVSETDGRREENANEEEAAFRQVKECLKEATGFGSYKAYVDSLFHQDPLYAGRSYNDILDACFQNPTEDRSGVDIIDVIRNDGHGLVGVKLRGVNMSAIEASMVLRDPAPGTAAQIILWPIDDNGTDFEKMMDVLGLGLQLDPSFFEPLRWGEFEWDEHIRSKTSLRVDSIGTSVHVSRRYTLSQGSTVHVVLIAGPLHTPVEIFHHERGDFHRNNVIYGLVNGAPLYDHFSYAGEPHCANVYIRALSNLLQSVPDTALTAGDILSAGIIPILQFEIAICKGDLNHFSGVFSGIKEDIILHGSPFKTKYRGRHKIRRYRFSRRAPDRLYRYRTKLRSWIEYFENQNGALLSLLSASFGPNIAKGPFYLQIKEESLSITRQSSRLEAELRDYLQLEVSKLSLEESKKSIQVSNRQIVEAKGVKIFTVLAFFYVPLNLATSIFGMNLQQLNGSGTSIGTFLATAGIALFLTGMSWLLVEGAHRVRVWLHQDWSDDSDESNKPYSHNIAVRLYMIWWLSRNGLFKWMIRTGAGWCILIKSSRGFRPADSSLGWEGMKASEFVSQIVREKARYLNMLTPGSGGWLPSRRDRPYGD